MQFCSVLTYASLPNQQKQQKGLGESPINHFDWHIPEQDIDRVICTPTNHSGLLKSTGSRPIIIPHGHEAGKANRNKAWAFFPFWCWPCGFCEART